MGAGSCLSIRAMNVPNIKASVFGGFMVFIDVNMDQNAFHDLQ
jgi:hypothetical protein